MAKESVKNSNSFGIISVNFGILSIILGALATPLLGIILGAISLIFGLRQKKISKNSWSKAGIILSVIGILISILLWVLVTTILAPYISNELLMPQ